MISSDSDSLTTLSGGGEDTSDSIWGGHHVVIGELVIHYGGYPGRVDGLDWWSWSTSSTPSPKVLSDQFQPNVLKFHGELYSME